MSLSQTSYVAAFRTYDWDDDIAFLAHRFFSACPGARQVVLVDETSKQFDTTPYEKVSHTSDMSALGLHEHPKPGSLWFNGDYAYVFLRTALPGFDHYIISESDVAVNISLLPMIQYAAEHEVDAIVHQLQPATPDWSWYLPALAQRDPWRAFLFISVFSGRALDHMLKSRLRLTSDFLNGETSCWPLVESFVPTCLREAGMRMVEFSEFADVDDLRFRPQIALVEERAHRLGSLAHPVLGRQRMRDMLLSKRTELIGSGQYEQLCTFQIWLASGLLARRAQLSREGDTMLMHRVQAWLDDLQTLMPARVDLAQDKPALTSSTSPWSKHPDPAQDARGANAAVLADDFGFHTALESDPWWQVDLLEPSIVEQIRIVNRNQASGRFRSFIIESSLDGLSWTTRLRKTDKAIVSSDPQNPWVGQPSLPFAARHIRITRRGGSDYLHLRQVQVFGHPIGAYAELAASGRQTHTPQQDEANDALALMAP